MVTHKIILENEKDIYNYCFEVLLSSIISTITIILISLFLKSTYNTIFFLLGFFICRKFSGGYHANTHLNCFLITQAIFTSFSILSKLIIIEKKILFLTIISLCATILVLLFAPVDNINKPMSIDERRKYKHKSIAFIIIYFFSICTLSYFSCFLDECIFFSLGVFSVSTMLFIGHLKNLSIKRKEVKYG